MTDTTHEPLDAELAHDRGDVALVAGDEAIQRELVAEDPYDDLDARNDLDDLDALTDLDDDATSSDDSWIAAGAYDGPIHGPDLHVGASSIHGTGVFASRAFEPDELVERCPVLKLDAEDGTSVADTMLGDYVYEWEDGSAVALGFGSLYNHSREPNARYEMDYEIDELHVVALRPIAPGDEVLINYNGDPTITTPVWFE